MLFEALFIPPAMSEAVSERAWFQAMLQAEASLAQAEAAEGVIPAAAAAAIAACCRIEHVDCAHVVAEARSVGNPVEPLVRSLRRVIPEEWSRYLHYGATSQDILDTASMLIARRALALIEQELAQVADLLATLADEHRDTLMVGRTLLQHALPTTFGLKAAQWLTGVLRAQAALRRLHADCLSAQFGGAVGTLAALDEWGTAVGREYARLLGLADPTLPWHTERSRLLEIAAALGLVAGVADKIALDITLLSQTEVGEVTEGGDDAHGGSSTMPQKRNPVSSVLTRACVRQAQPHIELLMRSMNQEQERATGAWHAEWQALTGALASTGGAVSWLRHVLLNLKIHPERMRANLDMTHGLVMAERVSLLLTERLGRDRAHAVIRAASRRTADEGMTLRDALLNDDGIRRQLAPEEIDRALDPASYLGSSQILIERALAAQRQARRRPSA